MFVFHDLNELNLTYTHLQTWDIDYDTNSKRISLTFTSREYVQVLKQFDDSNMKGKYMQIIKIERIQNERWFLQYAA